ncbi:MAG: 16S rRNA (uracil(1498)-N(3))-methyltransferase [Tissierellia bacterium]|nr:16S rRNA (uracil(1498)-N(3))-methyltransferase [Tissierellia bacterium]
MNRFFIDDEIKIGEEFEISGDDGRHITRSLRIKKGELIEGVAFGKAYLSEVIDVNREDNTVIAKAIEPIKTNEPMTSIRLFQGLTKSKEDFIIQKGTEVGISDFFPIEFIRSVSKIKGKQDNKMERWQKIARESAMQSKRDIIPRVHYPKKLIDIKDSLEGLSIVLYEEELSFSLKDCLKKIGECKIVNIFVGPEGGFDSSEIKFLIEIGVHSVSLGRRILRTETAGLVASSIVLYEYGDMEI